MSRDYLHALPESILFDDNLSIVDMRVYALIQSFHYSKSKCWAGNKWLAEKVNVSLGTVKRSLKKLSDLGYIVKKFINAVRYLYIKLNPLKSDDPEDLEEGFDNGSPGEGGGSDMIQGGITDDPPTFNIYKLTKKKPAAQKRSFWKKKDKSNQEETSRPQPKLWTGCSETKTDDKELIARYRTAKQYQEMTGKPVIKEWFPDETQRKYVETLMKTLATP